MKHYYAIFKQNKDKIEIEFPDLPGCVTYGTSWEDALNNAEDVLAAWLANAEPQFIKQPSSHEKLAGIDGEKIPIAVDEKLLGSYREPKRFNVIFPADVLRRLDNFRKKAGFKRSTLLQLAAEEYLQKHSISA